MASAGVDIGSLLAGLGAGGGGLGDQGGGFPPQQGPPDQQGGQSIPDLLQQAFELIHQALGLETDPLDKDAIGKALMAVQAVLAQEQKDKDQALGGSGGRLMRRNR